MTVSVSTTDDHLQRFSARIREATGDDHERTERSPFIASFLDGVVEAGPAIRRSADRIQAVAGS